MHNKYYHGDYNLIIFCISGGRRGNITLSHVLGFSTGTDEEPVLGFALQPSIRFVEGTSFIPTASQLLEDPKSYVPQTYPV